jgi:hypothetical protein
MSWKKWLLTGLAGLLTGTTALAHGGVAVGIGIGFPIFPRPCCYAPYYYPGYYYRPVYVEPAPVYVAPAPIVVPQPVVVQPAPAVAGPQPSVVAQPTPTTPVTSTFQATDPKKTMEAGTLLQLLNDPDEKTRAEAVIQLGRLKSDPAVPSLCATLAGDKSPVVRESAARALGLICAPRSLTALIHAAQADADSDVRRSASFAVEIIKLNHNIK